MSVTPFPDPRTTNFIPEAWQYIDLWSKFINYLVSYPRAQNFTINFLDPVFLTTRTALTQWADTAYATAQIVAWVTANVTPILGSAFTSAVLQYYYGDIAVNTINPLTTGGTLLIGNGSATNNVEVASREGRSVVLHLGDGNTSAGAIHINNGTNTTGGVEILSGTGSTGTITLGSSTSTLTLNAPLTPLYSPIFTSQQIGFILPTTLLTNDGGGGGGHTSLRSIAIPEDGVYILNGAILGPDGPPFTYPTTFYGYSFSTVGPNPANVDANFILRQVTGIQIQSPRPTRFSTTFTIAARLTAGTIYFNIRLQNAYTVGSSEVKVMRIA
jgi:hypothetical protein